MQPAAVLFGEVGHGVDGVEVAGVDLTGAPDDDRGAVEPPERDVHRVEVDPSGVVAAADGDGVAAGPEDLHRLAHARVHVPAGEYRHRRQPGQPVGGDVATVLWTPTTGAPRRAR